MTRVAVVPESRDPNAFTGDIDTLIATLSVDEKVELLAGQGTFKTTGLPERGIPRLVTSDGPHGLRGYRAFERHQSCLLPSATAMGATFDKELMHRVGRLLGTEARNKNIHVLLAPTVCLQRSPLLGRGFEAFGEDPVLSGLLAAAYVNGVQELGVATSIKHFAAHDQSRNSIEDNVVMTDRTLREVHLLPFQLALRDSNPWTFMTSYNKINGVHSSEDPYLLQKILREEWGFQGLVMSDWWGTYSTSEALNAGLDLEMPGPTQFRGKALSVAVNSRKVSHATLNNAVRRLLELTAKVTAVSSPLNPAAADTPENRALVRKVAGDSIVLLKNKRQVLPLAKDASKTYGLIGDHFKHPALGGGGSAEVDPYYSVTPYEAMVELFGESNLTYAPGCSSFKFSPLLVGLMREDGSGAGWDVEIFVENPEDFPDARPVFATTTEKQLVDVPESMHATLPHKFYVRARTTYATDQSCDFRFGLGVSGKGKLFINGKQSIDLWTDQPPKLDDTPCFNRLCTERFCEVPVEAGKRLSLEILMVNEDVSGGVGTALTLCGRLGGVAAVDTEKATADAVEVARSVDVPILMTGLSLEYESEGSDRKHLRLPPGVDSMIERVLEANPNTIIVTQSGLPIEMPWESKADTLLHAWYGGQEVGHGLVDVLFGTVNPSAKLSLTFPRSIKHNPAYLSFGKADYELMYGEGVFIGHRWYEAVERDPLFWFGHGLSYSTFRYTDLAVPSTFESSPAHVMEVTVRVENTGTLAGAEVVQAYIQDPESSLQRPARELKAFDKVFLAAGEAKTVKLALDRTALSFWSEEHKAWKAEAGTYHVILASSASPGGEIVRGSFELGSDFFWSGA
ncbi:family 3 glycosyl hydrolase [Plectosphaerella plurivora]|uniref:beta-glucosidase n=1 Tax=Plectosphaerella plurivora TaxID=936078 RepID=A0A9P8VAG8_9PEZI|nr:family 3 glycosyl hydrolase [Plectosphaerella plurivora]